jgi:hypothetical protein
MEDWESRFGFCCAEPHYRALVSVLGSSFAPGQSKSFGFGELLECLTLGFAFSRWPRLQKLRSFAEIVEDVCHASRFPRCFVSIPTFTVSRKADLKSHSGLQLRAQALASKLLHLSLKPGSKKAPGPLAALKCHGVRAHIFLI